MYISRVPRAPKGLFIATFICLACSAALSAQELRWPETSQQTKPWSRWWWQGSAVNPAEITASLEAFASAGLGGLEITPIYGVRGYEGRFIDYLSPEWVAMLEHALGEAERLGLGIDMATGTGWPFGGPEVTAEDASRYLAHKTYTLTGGQSLAEPVVYQQETIVRSVNNQIYETILGKPSEDSEDRSSSHDPKLLQVARPLRITDLVEPIAENDNLQALALDQIRFPKPLPLQALMAYSDDGRALELTDRVDADGRLDWTAPEGNWTLYAIFIGWHGKMVERAAPGGEGNVIDHFSQEAVRNYLQGFDKAFEGRDLSGLRAYFNDSYEVDDAQGQADWTPAFLSEFEKRRGYDLLRHLPALLGNADADSNARVLADYRATISDLLLDAFTLEWAQWASKQNKIIRNQAHGSPANVLDLYAASDIPEVESLRPLRVKWGISAGNVTGRPLIGAETATWLDEHFVATLDDVRGEIDHFLLNGVNHIVYHGTNFSPSDAPWPGWLFYATTHFNPQNSWWNHFDALNAYVTRVQSFLQDGNPDNETLLYLPIYAHYAVRGPELLRYFGGDGDQQVDGSDFTELTIELTRLGYAHDFVSDRQLLATTVDGNFLRTEGNRYRTVVVPTADYIELSTFEQLLKLAGSGATIVFHKALPGDIAGLANLEAKRSRFAALKASLTFKDTEDGKRAQRGRGAIVIADQLEHTLSSNGLARETLVDHELSFLRRRDADDSIYFIANRSERDFAGWARLAKSSENVALFEPMTSAFGYAPTRLGEDGQWQVYLEIPSGTSLVARASATRPAGPAYPFYTAAGSPKALTGTWSLSFLEGGPTLPLSRKMKSLGPWTSFEDQAYRDFSGTAEYRLSFKRPSGKAEAWRLDLGTVHDSAEVLLNGEPLGTLIGPDYQLVIQPEQLDPTNTLAIRVSNRMANRVAHLDREGVSWKNHYNVNFPARRPANRDADGLFTAENWEPLPAGLAGPVALTPLASKRDF